MNDEKVDPTVITSELVCDCEYCKGGRLVHWFCDGCSGGPFRFSFRDPAGAPVKSPYGQRQYNKTSGLVGGIRRWCSAACAITEEKVYLIDLLEKAQLRKDLTTVRVVTGRLHEMAKTTPVSGQIRTVTEKHLRQPERAKSLTATKE